LRRVGAEKREEKERTTGISNESEKLFRYDRNLRTRPAAGILDQPDDCYSARFLTRLLYTRLSGRYTTLIPPFAGAMYMHWRTTPHCNPICMPRQEKERERERLAGRAFVHAEHVTSKITLIAHVMCITCAKRGFQSQFAEKFPRLDYLRRGAQIYVFPFWRRSRMIFSRSSSTIKVKIYEV